VLFVSDGIRREGHGERAPRRTGLFVDSSHEASLASDEPRQFTGQDLRVVLVHVLVEDERDARFSFPVVAADLLDQSRQLVARLLPRAICDLLSRKRRRASKMTAAFGLVISVQK